MSRRPNPRAELMRLAVAEEAARIMGEQGVDDFLQAKRKAAERLGVTDASILPRNTEIEAALVARKRLFSAERHEAELAVLRRSALEAMRLMADFHPRLVGPVLAGTASAHSEINLHLFSDSAEAVSLRLESTSQGLIIDADPIRVEQLLGNLLANAVRHARPSGEVSVRLGELDAGWAEIRVIDDGEGIPEEALPFVFERFYRAGRSRSRSEGGTGLGLAIARNLVELHGGQIEAANRPQGGAELIVRLPRTAASPPPS